MCVRRAIYLWTMVLPWLTACSVIVSTIIDITYLRQELSARDTTFDAWAAVLCADITQNISIITACVPYLKPFFTSLQSGMIRADDLKRRGQDSTYAAATSNSSKTTKNKSSGTFPTIKKSFRLNPMVRSRSEQASTASAAKLPFDGPTMKSTAGVTVSREGRNHGDAEVGSQSSDSRMIRQTTTWVIDVDGVDR